MAIVKHGTIVVGIRGTVGGLTFSANGSGPHCRIWSKGATPQTVLAGRIRGRMSSLGALWNSMSAGERSSWTTFGLTPPEVDTNSLGEVYYLSGWQWFCRVNQRLQSVGLALTTTLPAATAVSAPASATVSAARLPTGPVVISWPGGTYASGYSGLAYLAVHPSIGLAAKKTHLVQIWAQHEPVGTSVDVTTAVQARFGNLPASWKVFVRLHVLRDDGVRSTAALASCEVS